MITINGKTYQGNNVVVTNGKVIIDGEESQPDDKVINIYVTADIERLEVDVCNDLQITGNCGSLSSTNARVNIKGDVQGNVNTTNGNVTCKKIKGKVITTNGNITSL